MSTSSVPAAAAPTTPPSPGSRSRLHRTHVAQLIPQQPIQPLQSPAFGSSTATLLPLTHHLHMPQLLSRPTLHVRAGVQSRSNRVHPPQLQHEHAATTFLFLATKQFRKKRSWQQIISTLMFGVVNKRVRCSVDETTLNVNMERLNSDQ